MLKLNKGSGRRGKGTLGRREDSMKIRASIDRRSGSDRRKSYKLGYFMAGGVERRSGKDRRTGQDRRVMTGRAASLRSAFVKAAAADRDRRA